MSMFYSATEVGGGEKEGGREILPTCLDPMPTGVHIEHNGDNFLLQRGLRSWVVFSL